MANIDFHQLLDKKDFVSFDFDYYIGQLKVGGYLKDYQYEELQGISDGNKKRDRFIHMLKQATPQSNLGKGFMKILEERITNDGLDNAVYKAITGEDFRPTQTQDVVYNAITKPMTEQPGPSYRQYQQPSTSAASDSGNRRQQQNRPPSGARVTDDSQFDYSKAYMYISYCTEQKRDVSAIVDALKARQDAPNVWFDSDPSGNVEETANAIRKCSTVAVFYSSEYCDSSQNPECQRELNSVASGNKNKARIFIKMKEKVKTEPWFDYLMSGCSNISYPDHGVDGCAMKLASFAEQYKDYS